MAEQKGGQVTHETNLMFDDDNIGGDVKKPHKTGDGSWSDADWRTSFPIIIVERLDLDDDDDDEEVDDDDDDEEEDDDDDDDDGISELDLSASGSNIWNLPSICSIFNDTGILGEQTERTDRLEYFATSPFDVLFEDGSGPRVASNNDSGGGYGGVSRSNYIDEMLLLMASPDNVVPTHVTTVANNASNDEATTGQSLEQERDRVSVGDSENSIDGADKRGEGGGGFLLGWWQKCWLLLGLWKLV